MLYNKRRGELVKNGKKNGETVGFVPTMGYFYMKVMEALITKARENNDKVVVSILLIQMQLDQQNLGQLSKRFLEKRQ